MEKNHDIRGYNQKIHLHDFQCKEIFYSTSKKHVIRGLHCSPYRKMITCMSGKIFDVMVNMKSLKSEINILSEGDQLLIPSGYAHGFYSYQDNTKVMYFLEGFYKPENDRNYYFNDPKLNINWPGPEGGLDWILSDRDKYNNCIEPVDFLIYGSTGYLGSNILKYVIEAKKSFALAKSRIQNYDYVEREMMFYKPKYVICAAGLSGVPNIDWCLSHRTETIRTNVIGHLNVMDICHRFKIHCTMFGTAIQYKYNDMSDINNFEGFTEEDVPNNTKHFYTELKGFVEDFTKYYNVLNLRVIYPISSDLHEKSLTKKLLKYGKVHNIPQSLTIIDDLFPKIIDMAEKNITGTYNFTNPGTICYNDLLSEYKKQVDSSVTWEVTNENTRSANKLDVSKLLKLYPDIQESSKSIKTLFTRKS